MSQFPSLPLFTDAFLADTGHLSAQETGAYLLLLMMAWRLPECRLPDDDQKLARWARVDARTWKRIKPSVMEFWTFDDGFWLPRRRHFGATERAHIPTSTRADLMASNECSYCGGTEGPFEIDHVIPLARGGSNEPWNLVLACRACNRSKKDRLIAEWLP